ncbi:MAG: hypothetical protein ACKO82_03990, partial [Acidimicrobiaceae bacterium]
NLNMSFANSQTTSAYQTLKVWFPTRPPMYTIADIVEQGCDSILSSLQQTNNIHEKLDMH